MDRWRSSDLQPRPRAGTDVCKHKKSSRRRKPSAFGDRKRRVQTEICPSTHASEPLPATPRPILRLKAAETPHITRQRAVRVLPYRPSPYTPRLAGVSHKIVTPHVPGCRCGEHGTHSPTRATAPLHSARGDGALSYTESEGPHRRTPSTVETLLAPFEHTAYCQP